MTTPKPPSGTPSMKEVLDILKNGSPSNQVDALNVLVNQLVPDLEKEVERLSNSAQFRRVEMQQQEILSLTQKLKVAEEALTYIASRNIEHGISCMSKAREAPQKLREGEGK